MLRRTFRLGLRLGILCGVVAAASKFLQSRRARSLPDATSDPWSPREPLPSARPEPGPPLREGSEPTASEPVPPPAQGASFDAEPTPSVPPPPMAATPSVPQAPVPPPPVAGPAQAPVAQPAAPTAPAAPPPEPASEFHLPPIRMAPITPDDGNVDGAGGAAEPPPVGAGPDRPPVKKASAGKAAAPKRRAPEGKAPGTKAPGTKPPAGRSAGRAWVEPSGSVCPSSHPVKAKLASGLYHLPGMAAYQRTRPDRCYADGRAAEGDGLTKAKR